MGKDLREEVRFVVAPVSEGTARTTGGLMVIHRPSHDTLWVGQPFLGNHTFLMHNP